MSPLPWRRSEASGSTAELRLTTRFRPEPGSPVGVQILGPNSLDVLTARDIAMRGLGIYVPHRFEGCDLESEVELVVTLPGQRPFLARGRVRHRTGDYDDTPFFGIEFVDLALGRRQQVQRYLESGLAKRIC